MSKQELAKKIFESDLVQRLDQDNFLVKGSKDNVYLVSRVEGKGYEFYCKLSHKDQACPAWKFDNEHECKHCLAVRLFEGKK